MPTMRHRVAKHVLPTLVALVAACGGGESPSQPSSIGLSLAQATITVAQGASGTVAVNTPRTNFSHDISLTASGAPAGVTTSFSPGVLTGTVAQSTMTIAASAAAAPGTTIITVTAAGSGVATQTMPIAVTVPPPPSYTLVLASSAVSVTAGASTTVNAALARTNFTGAVTFAVSGLPPGATASFTPGATTADASALTINTGTAAPGAYPLTVTASAAGLADRTAALSLTITAGTGSPNVSFAFCPDELPAWVGYQSGTGTWQQASAGANNTYSFSVLTRGAVAVVSPVGGNAMQNGYESTVYYASASELQSIGANNCERSGPVGTKVVNGSVTGTGGQQSTIVLGSSRSGVVGDVAFRLTAVENGPRDLLAALSNNTTFTTTRLAFRRNLDVANGATLSPIDFAGSESFAPLSSTVTLPGIASGTRVLVSSTFSTANASSLDLGFQQATAATATYHGVPVTAAGDLHELDVFLDEATGFRGSIAYFTAAGNRTMTFGAPLSAATVTSLGATPYSRLRATFASQAEYASVALISLMQGAENSAPTDRYVAVIMTPAYLGGVPATWDLSIPDMSAAAGFSSSWMLGAGRPTDVVTGAYGGNIFQATPTNGTVFQFAQRAGTTVTTLSAAPTAVRLAPAAPSSARVQRQAEQVQRFAHNRRVLRLR